MKLPILTIVQMAVFAAIIAICAQIQIPFVSGVPFTLQTTGVILSGLILGPKKGTMAVVVYVLLGAAGVPVFAGFSSGIGIISGYTGGFILSFPLLAFVSGIASTKKQLLLWPVFVSIGVAANLTLGMVWFSFVTGNTLPASFTMVVLPFLITSLLQIIASISLGRSLRYAISKSRITI
ncbi:MAG: biotin transporter BioY [Defluviitaleaceae bacterium]|nr:biotin transporter BioY [Defluviitaleaceae bacterium]